MKFTKILFAFFLLCSIILNNNIIGYASYDRYGAAIYGDDWALSRNSNFPSFGSDCTNFVSQCIHQGGTIPFDSDWYCYYTFTGWDVGHIWALAPGLRTWMINTKHYTVRGTWGPNDQENINNYVQIGDVYFYDWGQGAGWSHAGIDADYGQDPKSSYYGDLADLHTTDRYHAIWHLKPYNGYAANTQITAIRPQ